MEDICCLGLAGSVGALGDTGEVVMIVGFISSVDMVGLDGSIPSPSVVLSVGGVVMDLGLVSSLSR